MLPDNTFKNPWYMITNILLIHSQVLYCKEIFHEIFQLEIESAFEDGTRVITESEIVRFLERTASISSWNRSLFQDAHQRSANLVFPTNLLYTLLSRPFTLRVEIGRKTCCPFIIVSGWTENEIWQTTDGTARYLHSWKENCDGKHHLTTYSLSG